jgi:5-methylcytosine-specific restriction endonuclease McrA
VRDPVKRKASQRAHYQRHAEEQRARVRAYNEANREQVLERGRVRARKRTREGRQAQRARLAAAKGREYLTRDEINQRAELKRLERASIRAARKPKVSRDAMWVERLRLELPAMYDPSIRIETLAYRARYNLDPAFRGREIERMASADARRQLMCDGSLTPDVLRSLFARRDCPYCGKRMAATDKSLDHITPVSKGGWHSVKNCVVCCLACNSRKRAMTPERWLCRLEPARAESVRRLWDRITGVVAQSWLTADVRRVPLSPPVRVSPPTLGLYDIS